MNYTGGKFKLLLSMLPLFPKDVRVFCDLFCGGMNVCLNAEADEVVANDACEPVVRLYEFLSSRPFEDTRREILARIDEFGLSDDDQQAYFRLRNEYASSRRPIDLFLLTTMCFNNQIRFNASGGFNMSFGRRIYNPSIEENLRSFVEALRRRRYTFHVGDFANPAISDALGKDDFVYCDPPYALSNAAYNVGWTDGDSARLLSFLDGLDRRGVRFALSEVMEHKGMVNSALRSWSAKYRVEFLDMSYGKCSYHRKLKESVTREVLVCNYDAPRNGADCDEAQTRLF